MRIDRDTIAIAVAGTERAGPSGLSAFGEGFYKTKTSRRKTLMLSCANPQTEAL